LELGPGVEVGVGDDAAVLAPTPGHRLVVTTDVLVEGLDFTAALSEPEDWGWKAVVANLSDLAAMGAEARWLVLALTVPDPTPVATLERVYAGVGEACRAFGVALVGGDVSGGPALSLAVTALGEAERPVLRWACCGAATGQPPTCWAASRAWPPPTAGPPRPWPWGWPWPRRGRRP
jgi:thiamine-monophosphate kinase